MSGDAVNGSPGAEVPFDLPGRDPGNPLVPQAPPLPALMSADVLTTPAGKLLELTIRTPDVTLTLKLQRKDVESWARFLADRAGDMTGIILPPGGGLIL